MREKPLNNKLEEMLKNTVNKAFRVNKIHLSYQEDALVQTAKQALWDKDFILV